MTFFKKEAFTKPGLPPEETLKQFTFHDHHHELFPPDPDRPHCHPSSGLVLAFSLLGLDLDPTVFKNSWSETHFDVPRLRASLHHTILTGEKLDPEGLPVARKFSQLLTTVHIGRRPGKTNFTLPPPVLLSKAGGCVCLPWGVLETATSVARFTPEGYMYECVGPPPFNMERIECDPGGAVGFGKKEKKFSLAALHNLAGRSEVKDASHDVMVVERCMLKWRSQLVQSLPAKISARTIYDHRKILRLGGTNLIEKIRKAEQSIKKIASTIGTSTTIECKAIFSTLKKMREGPDSDVGKTSNGWFYNNTVGKQKEVLNFLMEQPTYVGKVIILGMGDAHLPHVLLGTSVTAHEIKKVPGQFVSDAFSRETTKSLRGSFVMSDVLDDYAKGRDTLTILTDQLSSFPKVLSSKTYSYNLQICEAVMNNNKYYEVYILRGGRNHNTEIFLTFVLRPVPDSLKWAPEIKKFLDDKYDRDPFPLLSDKNFEQALLLTYTRPCVLSSAYRNLAYVNGHTPSSLPEHEKERLFTFLGMKPEAFLQTSYHVSIGGGMASPKLILKKVKPKQSDKFVIKGMDSRVIPIPEFVEGENVDGGGEDNGGFELLVEGEEVG